MNALKIDKNASKEKVKAITKIKAIKTNDI